MDKGSTALSQVQRGVVSVVAEISACVLRNSHFGPDVELADSFTNYVHVQHRADAVGAVLHAALRLRAEVAVVRSFVALVVAALLKSDFLGQTRDADVDHKLRLVLFPHQRQQVLNSLVFHWDFTHKEVNFLTKT